PPSPARTCSSTRSTKVVTAPPHRRWPESVSGRDDADGTPPPPDRELHVPVGQREQGVVAAPADQGAGVELGAALPDQDLPRVHELAAEPLHTQPLGLRVAPVPRTGGTLLVGHLCRLPYLPVAMPATFTRVSRCR